MVDSKVGSVSSLIDSGPAAVADWYDRLRTGHCEKGQEWWPLTVATAAAGRARDELDSAWRAVAIEILEDLAKEKADRDGAANLLSAMSLRAHFIERLGPGQSGELRDLELLVEWFLARVECTAEVAREKALRWQKLEVSEIRALRDIKNRLAVFVGLDKRGMLARFSEIRPWLDLRDLLP